MDGVNSCTAYKEHWETYITFKVFGHKLSRRVPLINSVVLDHEGMAVVWVSELSETLQDTYDLTIIPMHSFSVTLDLMGLVSKVSAAHYFMFSWCESSRHLVNLCHQQIASLCFSEMAKHLLCSSYP